MPTTLRIGRVTIEEFRDSYRLRWTVDNKTYSETVGRILKPILAIAKKRAHVINVEIAEGKYDKTYLQKYKQLTLQELWPLFLQDTLVGKKAKTSEAYFFIDKLLTKVGWNHTPYELKQRLLSSTTPGNAHRVLAKLKACYEWAIAHSLATENPYAAIASKLHKPPAEHKLSGSSASAFTPIQVDKVLRSFTNSPFIYYAPLVEFLFYTGARPSEAIALPFDRVKEDCSIITLGESWQEVQTYYESDGTNLILKKGDRVKSDTSKNNKLRTIKVSSRVRTLLKNQPPGKLVFPSPGGKVISYHNFFSRIWKKVVDPIKENTTPYNCRDTFITDQLLKGASATVVATYCDTSVGVIERHYLDKLQLLELSPIE
jgi:integrase